jgi:Zn-dependent protease
MVNGSIKLFRLFGIDVFLHWSWFLIAAWLIPNIGANQFQGSGTEAYLWSTALYVALFAIVTMHEFGHALACRSVGGQAKHIVLWPLGGVAFVSPPQRPGAVLWSIVAGPLVNVMLVPVTVLLYFGVGGTLGNLFVLPPQGGDLVVFCRFLLLINLMLLIFNMLPVYPLDGGQTLMALLWFVIGRALSLQIVSIIGLVVAGFVVLLAAVFMDLWMMVLALFIGFQAWVGFQNGMKLSRMDARQYDQRHADRAANDEVERRIQSQIDPWRR